MRKIQKPIFLALVLLVTVLILPLAHAGSVTFLDTTSYLPTPQDPAGGFEAIGDPSGACTDFNNAHCAGEFWANSVDGLLTTVKTPLCIVAGYTGSVHAFLYAGTGSEPNGLGTGSVLASSDAYDGSGLPTCGGSPGPMKSITFSGANQYHLLAGQKYAILIGADTPSTVRTWIYSCGASCVGEEPAGSNVVFHFQSGGWSTQPQIISMIFSGVTIPPPPCSGTTGGCSITIAQQAVFAVIVLLALGAISLFMVRGSLEPEYYNKAMMYIIVTVVVVLIIAASSIG